MSESRDDATVDMDGLKDPEEYTTGRRLKDIFDAKRDARKARLEAARVRRDHPAKAAEHYRHAVETFLLEVDSLFSEYKPGLWADERLGTFVIHPPGRWVEPPHGINVYTDESGQIDGTVTDPPRPVSVPVDGLNSLFIYDTPVEAEFEMEFNQKLETETHTSSGNIPWQILDHMVTRTSEALADMDLGLEPETDDEWEI